MEKEKTTKNGNTLVRTEAERTAHRQQQIDGSGRSSDRRVDGLLLKVEGGKKKPFPPEKVDFAKLAQVLNADAAELQRIAVTERGQIELDLRSTESSGADMAVALALRLRSGTLSSNEIASIRKILKRRHT